MDKEEIEELKKMVDKDIQDGKIDASRIRLNEAMKTVKVVAAIIKKNGKIFATQRGYGEFKDTPA